MLRRSQGRNRSIQESINLSQEKSGESSRWNFLLVVFMRCMSVLWLFYGLRQWQLILAPGDAPLDALPTSLALATVFFAVADLLAAVGLWLAATWGGILWLFSASASIIISLFMPGFRADGALALTFNFVLIMVYFVLNWLAALERDL
jgi:hypothetical protein